MQFSRPQGVSTQSGTHQRHKMFTIIHMYTSVRLQIWYLTVIEFGTPCLSINHIQHVAMLIDSNLQVFCQTTRLYILVLMVNTNL